jgi:hypothetical protein
MKKVWIHIFFIILCAITNMVTSTISSEYIRKYDGTDNPLYKGSVAMAVLSLLSLILLGVWWGVLTFPQLFTVAYVVAILSLFISAVFGAIAYSSYTDSNKLKANELEGARQSLLGSMIASFVITGIAIFWGLWYYFRGHPGRIGIPRGEEKQVRDFTKVNLSIPE